MSWRYGVDTRPELRRHLPTSSVALRRFSLWFVPNLYHDHARYTPAPARSTNNPLAMGPARSATESPSTAANHTLASERAQLITDLEAILHKLAELTVWAQQEVAA